jgi:hypothetical protein
MPVRAVPAQVSAKPAATPQKANGAVQPVKDVVDAAGSQACLALLDFNVTAQCQYIE